MFTGIIQSVAKVVSLRMAEGGRIIRIHLLGNKQVPTSRDCLQPPKEGDSLSLGESIAVNGVCLTVCKVIGNDFEVYIGAHTISCTNLSKNVPGSKVNLERALRIGDRLGGHLVQGHIDGVAKIVGRREKNGSTILSICPQVEWMKYLVPNGSIAIDGVSLTIASIKGNKFDVALIPYTMENTTLSALKVGDLVNFEVDIIGKYLIRV